MMDNKNRSVPEIRFKGFDDDWTQRKLGEIAEFNPRSILPTTFEYVDLESVVGTSLIYHRTENADTAPSRAQRLAQKGDVFYQTVRPYQMNNYLYDLSFDNFVFSTGYAQLKPSGDSYFLLSRLQEKKFVADVLDKSTGTSYPAINSSDLAKIKVGIAPNIHEQSKIGSFFRTLDDIIHATQQKVTGLKQLKAAYLQQMFPQDGQKVPRVRFEGFSGDWNDMKLGEIAETYSGGTPSVGIRSYYNGVIPFIRSAEINSDKTELYLSNDGLKNSSAKMVNVGTILYALYGATSGEVGRSKIAGAINQAILAIEPKDHYNSEFISQWLRRQKESIVSTYLQGGQGNLSAAIIKELPITTPLLSEQTAIGNFLCNLDMQIEIQSEKAEKLKQLKVAYLQKMFI